MLGLLGFKVALYPARVFVEGAWRDSMSHCVTVARLPRQVQEGSATAANGVNESAKEEVWISDVGFGSSPLIPLRYDRLGEEQEGDAEWSAFRFSRVVSDVPADNGTECILLERCARADGQWQKNLLIYLQPQTLAQLVPSCEARTLPALWLSLADDLPCESCGEVRRPCKQMSPRTSTSASWSRW